MLVAYKNYKRTERVELSIRSVRHFMPNVPIHCLCLIDETEEEYSGQLENIKNMNVKIHFNKNKHKLGPAFNSPVTGVYYTEYLNYFSEMFKNEQKVLAMDEDMYFTTGTTLRWVEENTFDIAYGSWWHGPNAAILGINFKKLNYLFPLPEIIEMVESIIQRELCDKAKNDGAVVKLLPNRNLTDYGGDGSYTNDTDFIRSHLKQFNII